MSCDREMNKPLAIDLFAGAGFMGLGFAQSGFRIAAAVEINPAHTKAHRLNFSSVPVLCQDVRTVRRTELYAAAGLSSRTQIDAVIGGSPCQGFSTEGHNRADDPRRSLAYEFIRIVGEVRPKHFVFENVKGLTMGKNKAVLGILIAEFARAGYDCAPWQVLDAQNYGVAQHRERLFLLGSRRDRPLINYPSPTKKVTCEEVLGDLLDGGIAEQFSGSRLVKHSEAVAERFSKVAQGDRDSISRFTRLHPQGIAPTLLAGTSEGSAKGGRHTAKRPIHYAENRVCTVRELARLHGIPDDIQLGDPIFSTCDGAMQVGNSVPPPLAKAVAHEAMKTIALSESWQSQSATRLAT
jgi:DNA (cytosine-5)-methyltransferase 1